MAEYSDFDHYSSTQQTDSENSPNWLAQHAQEFFQAAGRSAIQTPLTAVAQLAEHFAPSSVDLQSAVRIPALQASGVADFGTAQYWTEQAGSAFGVLAPFAIVGRSVRAVTRAGLTETQMAANFSGRQVLGLTMKEAFITGAVHDALLRPVEDFDSRPFAVAKASNGMIGGTNMWILSRCSVPLANQGGLLRGVISSVPGSLVTTYANEYLNHLKFSSAEDFVASATSKAHVADLDTVVRSLTTNAVLGGVLGKYHDLIGSTKSRAASREALGSAEAQLPSGALMRPSGDVLVSLASDGLLRVQPPPGSKISGASVENPYLRAIEEYRAPGGTEIERALGNTERSDYKLVELKRAYSWAVPDATALDMIRDFAPNGVVEVMAGKGYWANVLGQMNVSVLPFDQNPLRFKPAEGKSRFFGHEHFARNEIEQEPVLPGEDNPNRNYYHHGLAFTEVAQGDNLVGAKHPNRALMMSWPPPESESSAATDAMNAYAGAGGTKLIFVGDKRGGQTAGHDFYNALRRDWQKVGEHKLITGGSVNLYERLATPVTLEMEGVKADIAVRKAQDAFEALTLKYGAAKGDIGDLANLLMDMQPQQLADRQITRTDSKGGSTFLLPCGSSVGVSDYKGRGVNLQIEGFGQPLNLNRHKIGNPDEPLRLEVGPWEDRDAQVEAKFFKPTGEPQVVNLQMCHDYSTFRRLLHGRVVHEPDSNQYDYAPGSR